MESPRWKIITPSQYEHERRGLDFVREGLPDHDPYRAWSNFEFQTNDGAIYEVDLLVLTKQGFWLIEIKSWQGRITGDSGTWTRHYNGKAVSVDNPLFLANRKAKALSTLLKAQAATKGVNLPWLDAVVFLSADDLQCELTGPASNRVFLKDRKPSESQKERKGILTAILNRDGQGIDPDPRATIDIKVAKAISRAMDSSGIRPSQRSRRVGDYILGDLIADGPGYQDRLATHVAFKDEAERVYCRVRQYTVAQASSEETRKKLQRAAVREFQIIQTLSHPGILPVLDYKDHELGPALLFRYTDPNAERLDHYLARKGNQLSTDERLNLLRQIADAIRYAHRKRVIHRALGPQSILVTEADTKTPLLQLYNWQVGIQQAKGTTTQLTKVEDLVEAQSLVYMSPEALGDVRRVSEASDIFSLGAIAFQLFTSRPPAGSVSELTQILRERHGLSVSAVLDGAGPRLEELILWSTHPEAINRIGSVEEFLTYLDDVEDELTSPDGNIDVDPLTAKRGDRLPHGYVVERVLGQGATARAMLVTRDETPFVLKVALTDDDNFRLREEAKALNKIQSEFVVKIYESLEIAGRMVLVLQKAGEESLAKHLRKYGVPALDLLARYGDNLLSAVASLERHGVVHRDIKPDNIGIHSLNKQQNQLILYDFSLASAPLDNLNVGTADYRDPFLKNRKSGKWDLAAERYSAGVTLYEMTLGHDQLPEWGKENSADTASTKVELVLHEEKFKPSVREGLATFFRKALHRNPDKRFDNAEEMRFAWQKVFKDAENQTVKTPGGDEIATSVSLDQAELDTLVAALDLSAQARDALDGLNLTTVKDLLKYPSHEIHMMRGVGDQYRREIIGLIAELRQKFPDVTGKKTSINEDETTPSLERLHSRVLGSRTGKSPLEWSIRSGLLKAGSYDEMPADLWPSQSGVAEALGESRAKIGQVLATDQKRWAKDGFLSAFRNELFEQIQRLGGVVTVSDLIDMTLLLRPATETEDVKHQMQIASAIARAAIETEISMAEPRLQLRRVGAKTIVACSAELADYAEKLGELADRICKADPLLPRLRAFQEIYDIPQPPMPEGCQPLTNERLIKLAAAMSAEAAISSRQEIYPRNMPAERALRLGIGVLSGLGLGETNEGFRIEQVHSGVNSRYPEAQALPTDPKELESMLQRVGIDVQWDAEKQKFRRRETKLLVTSGSSIGQRRITATSTRHIDSTAPETVHARADEDRLQHAFRDGGFLIVTVKPSRMRDCERELLHRFHLEKVSFDDLLFRQLRAKSTEYEFPWSDIFEADAESRNSDDWKNLLHLVSEVTPLITEELMQRARPLLLVHPGLIARYDQMSVLQTLRDRIGHDVACPSLWVLVASDNQSEMPYLDGVQIPLISTGQRAFVSEYWIDNLHRGRTNEAVAAKLKTAKGGP